LWGLVTTASGQVTGQIVQQFFVPFPEADFKTSLQAIAAGNPTGNGISNQIMTTISIVVGTSNTIIVYDHWEDGYENDLNNPTQPSTLIWGNGNTNTPAPGYPSNILPPGAVITLTNVVTLPRNPSVVQYDGRDRIGATRPVTVTRAGWATNIGTLMATATEVYDTTRYGTSFIIPVGTNTTPTIQNFSYSSLHIIAAQDNTVVKVDVNGDGIVDLTNTLNMGESMFVNGGVLCGATVTANNPVQVHELTGRISSDYQSRTFAIRPVSQWDTNYYAPVGTTTENYAHNVFVFNQFRTNLTVLYSTMATNGSFTVSNYTTYKFPMPLNSGARFYTTNGAAFYAVGCDDTGSSNPDDNQDYDWGYALLPAAALTPVAIVGWAPGSDFTSGAPANGSPVWVTPTKATTIYVNYSGNYNSGPLIAPNGNHYDTNFTLVAYQFQTIFNPTTKNMTGARIFTVDGTTFAAAWGEDPAVAGSGLPYMDAGTGIIPFPQPTMSKSSQLVVDVNGNGKPGWGDTMEYTIQVQNLGMLVLGNVLVLDALPNTVTYVTNSTTLNGVPVADNLVPPAATAFPLDESGLVLPEIQVDGYSTLTYRVVINSGATSISNAVLGSAGDQPVTSTESFLVAGPVTLAFTDASGNPVSSYVTNSGIYISLIDLIQNTNASTAQTVTVTVSNVTGGDVESLVLTETGTNTGIFRNTTPLPMSTTAGTNKNDGTLHALAGNFLLVSYTDPISGVSGSATVTVTASPMPYVTKSSLLVVDLNGNSLIGWGDTVQYSILLTNTTAQAITNLVVLDTLPANVSYVTNSTASNGVAVADSGATPFPLDEAGLSVRSLAASNSTLVTFRVTVNSGTSISNSVTVTNLNGLVQAQNVASVTPPPPSCNLNFTDGSGNPVTTCVQNAGLYVTMTDNSQNTSPTNAQTVTVTITNVSGGDVESLTLTETGTNTGVFRNTTALPTSTIFGTAQQDGTLNGSAGQVITVYFAGAGGETCSASATFVPAVQTKKLYLSAVNASNLYQSLNRINPVAAGATSTSNSVALTNGSNATFVQTPVFCQPFVLSADSPVAVTNYVSILSGSMPASPAIRAMLMQGTNAATATNILTLTNAAYSGGLLGWSGTLSSNVTVGAGETTFLVITSAQSGASFSIQYNSASKPSAISLPTTTVISLEQLGVYDAPYPGGNLVTNAVNAQTIYIRGTASDPFGAYDVTKISLYLLDPGGYAFTTNLTGAYLVASNACSSTYEYPWVTENWQGSYSVLATAYEGTEGITNALQTVFQAHYPSGGTPSTTTFIDSSGNPTNSYATNQTVCVQVQNPDANQNPAAVETVSVVITTTSGDRETVTLTETGTNTGVFTGCITANTGAAVPGNGVLNAPGGSGLIATYTDALFPSNTSSNSAIVRLPPGPQPVVSLFKTLVAPANSTVLLGSTVQFNLEVANPGSVTVTNVTLTDTFPSNRLQFVSATIPANSSTPAGTLTWTNLGPLTPGTNLIISAFFTAKMAGALTNSATVTGTTNVGPVTAMATNNVSAIAVTKTLVSPIPGPAYINSNVVFQIAIANTGVKAITSYQLQDLFSSACFQFLGASVPPSGSGGGVVLWSSMPALAVGASTNIYVTNKVIGDCEPAVNNANISSVVDQSGDSVPNAQSSASITNLGASISGLVWYDANANGTNDAGDSPLASVNVYVDLNGDGVRQGNEPYATTDTNGLYEIVSIPAGSYAVRVDTNSLPAGVRPTYDLDGTNTPNTVSLIISNGQVFTNLNFGYVGSGSISGYIWNDLNGDGVLEAGEPGLSGVTVFIDLNANGVRDAGEPYIASAPDGSFAFDYLVANTYRVAVDILSLPPNMRPTFDLDGTNTPNVATITLGAGQNVTNANFGYQGRASLTGLITDTSTGFPVTGATVVVVDSLGNTQTVTTSVSGTYSVPSLWTGPAIVTVGKTGYGSAGANPTIAGGANTQNLSLTPNTLAGVVTNTLSGQAIAGATVLVVDSASVTNTLTSDASGHYTLTNIAAGVATVTASESGYLTSSASPTIVAGANTQNLGLTPNTLAGVVTDAITTLPIAGATVVVTDSSNIVHTITTDGAGHYGVTNLPTGLATVSASKTGYGSSGSSPTIVAGANTQNLMLTANTLAGVVTNTLNGQPIVGATVLVVDSASVTNTLTTDVSGHYGVTNIAAGIATITASQSGYVTASVSPTIVAGANTQDLGLTPNTLTGLVTDAVTTLPIVGASVAVTDSSNAVHAVTTDATGHYSVTVLPTGPASVTASQIGYGSAGANPTIIAGANIQNLSLTANTLVGVITNTATGLPISAAAVQVVDSANVTNTIATDSNGHYGVTNIAAGIITITASQSGYVAASASPTIVTGANAQDLGLTPNSLTGLVTDAVTMLPIAGATVAVTDSSNAVHTVTTDATGHYSVTVLPTGPASVTASQIGYGSAGANPTILPGANTQNLTLTANTLLGVITNTATGLPISAAAVQVVDSANVTNTIATDSNGHYGVTNIAAGIATITASQSGYVAASASPTIVTGANAQDLGLTPNTLTGLVTDAVTTLPIVGASVAVTDSSNGVHTVTTDATGHYSVTVLPTGPASVTASQIGYGSAGANPTIVAGANIQNLSLTANTLVGVITNTATGLPIAGATVQVVDSANVTNTIATDSNGHYGVTNIAAGIATITASQSGYVAASASPTIVTGANAQDLGLTPNSLTGLVTDAVTMLPIAGATVAVTDSSNAVHTVTTDATGHYSVTVLPTGPATVTASQIGYGSAGANPTIVAGANIQNLSLTANTLTGIITDSLSGLPIAGASVAVIDSAGVNTSIVTGPSGAYSVSGIAAGAASVTANMVGYSSANASPVISAGANTQDLKLTPNILTGHVTDAASQQPLAGVLVQVIDGAGTTNTITTDATGYYGVTNIAPGVATVTASKSGYNTATATPTIVAGPNTQDLQLSVSNPTLALLSSIKAYLAGDGVLVRWQTASEAGSVSFDLYRQNPAGGNWVKVNAAPVLAANSPTGSTYDVADPDAKPAETLAYRLVELEEQGTTRTYGPFGLHADAPTPAAPPKALVTETASPLAKAALVRSPQSLTQTSSAPLSTLDGSRFIKIITTNSGIQNVTATALGIALGQAPANIQSAILARSLLLSNQGQPVAYVASADGSALSFYAEPLKNNYTAQNVYSLTFAPGLPLGTVLSPPTTPVPAARLAYLAELDLEQDLLAVPSLVQDPSQDFWMWQRLVAGIPMFNTAAFSFALDHLSVSGSGTASLTLHLLGGDQATHTVQVTLNGSLVGQDTWQGCTPHDTVLQIPSSLLIEGANQLSLQAVATAGSATSQWYVNSFGLNYPRQYFAVNGTLLFNANSNMVITVDGFTSPAITVLEISDPNQPALVQNLTIAPTDAGYSASFAPADPQNQFVAFQSGAGTTPASVACAQTANLSRAANAADYIIIAPDSLTAPAGQLAAYRQRKGLRPVVVSLDQVYDEFSSGIITPEAIRQFLRTALTNWVVKPRYVVLIGNGTYDYRDLLQQHDNLMPPLLVNTSYGLFCSDSAYGDLNGDGQPEIAVGRLPVKTAQQLLALIGKIQSYEALPQTAPAQALLVADAPDSAGDFTAAIQQVSTTLVGSYSNTVVQGAGQSNLGPVRQAIQSSLNAGVDLVDYIGHGAIDRFGNYGYLTSADVAALQNGARLPVVVAVTCVAGQYSVPGSDCLAGYLSMQNAGGAIAVVAPTGLSVDQDASRLNLRLLNLLRANTGPGLGDMFRQALADHVALDNPTTQPAIYNLIGDPALAYNVAVQASTAAPQFTGASVTNGVLVITWSGGQPPYQLEQTTTLGPKASWQAVGSPVSGFTTTLPVTGPMGFIRVRCSR
jgi:uncharacterized repeat protein (TIGR01451 family)